MSPSRSSPGPGSERHLPYDVRFWNIRVRAGKRRTRYAIRWIVAGHEFHDSFTTKAHAESRLSELRTAARKGEAFDVGMGLPVSETQQRNDRSWYEHASLYVERRWPRIGGGQRRSIADTIATATPAMLTTDRGQPAARLLRRTMYAWVGNMTRRRGGPPPEEIAEAMAWLEHNTRGMSTLADQNVLDTVLDLLAVRLDGKPAAPNTISRRRSIIHNMLATPSTTACLTSIR